MKEASQTKGVHGGGGGEGGRREGTNFGRGQDDFLGPVLSTLKTFFEKFKQTVHQYQGGAVHASALPVPVPNWVTNTNYNPPRKKDNSCARP